jgi:transglutaminase-like putative cysteine protease
MAEMEWVRPLPAAAAQPRLLYRAGGRFLDWEDWLTLALVLATIVSVSLTVEGGGWSEQMPAITLVAVIAAVTAMLMARAGASMLLAWPAGVVAGAAVVLWQTLVMVGPGTLQQRLDAVYWRFEWWLEQAFSGGVSNDPLPFNVLVLGLTWLAIFLFGWSVFRWHNAWLGLVPGGFLLFIDLAFVGDSLGGATLLFLLFGFLLLMRTNLMSRMSRWRREGAPYPPLLSITFLNFSFWALLGLLLFAWLLPAGPFSTPVPVQSIAVKAESLGIDFVRLAGPLRVKKVVPVHNYSGLLPFQGSIKLGARELLTVKVNNPDVQGPYLLRGSVYDYYESGGWKAGRRDETALAPLAVQHLNEQLQEGKIEGTIIPIQVQVEAKSVAGSVIFAPGMPLATSAPVTVKVPHGALHQYFVRLPNQGRSLGDYQILRDELPASIIGVNVIRDQSGAVVAIEGFDGHELTTPDNAVLEAERRLNKGASYGALGFVPAIDPQELREASRSYPFWVQDTYLQLPERLPGRVRELARTQTLRTLQARGVLPQDGEPGSDAISNVPPYEIARAIEEYLRGAYPVDYDVPDTPPGRDTVDYFLFDARRGYFDYHASAMVVMLRSLGIAARLGVGFVTDEADYDGARGGYVIRDRNAYAWPEVYFPGHGWVVFNPTPDRPADLSPQTRERPLPGAETDPGDLLDHLPVGADPIFDIPAVSGIPSGSRLASASGGTDYTPFVPAALAAFAAVAAGAAALGWRRSVAGLPYAQQIWEKMVRLSSWAGCPPEAGQTPGDYANALQRRFRGLRGVSLIASAYSRSRFGRREPDRGEAAQIEELWPQIRGALFGAILARIVRRR